jgi:LPXTG-motif cell wall-anchored protein
MIVEVEEVAVVEEVAAAPAPAALPKTGSLFPLIGLIGGLMMAGSAGMRLVRK